MEYRLLQHVTFTYFRDEELMDIAEQLPDGDYWYSLGLLLNIPKTQLDVVRNSMQDERWCKQEILKIWRSHCHHQPTSLYSLTRALYKLGLDHLACHVEYVAMNAGNVPMMGHIRQSQLQVSRPQDLHLTVCMQPTNYHDTTPENDSAVSVLPRGTSCTSPRLLPRSPYPDTEPDMMKKTPTPTSPAQTKERSAASPPYASRGPHPHGSGTYQYPPEQPPHVSMEPGAQGSVLSYGHGMETGYSHGVGPQTGYSPGGYQPVISQAGPYGPPPDRPSPTRLSPSSSSTSSRALSTVSSSFSSSQYSGYDPRYRAMPQQPYYQQYPPYSPSSTGSSFRSYAGGPPAEHYRYLYSSGSSTSTRPSYSQEFESTAPLLHSSTTSSSPYSSLSPDCQSTRVTLSCQQTESLGKAFQGLSIGDNPIEITLEPQDCEVDLNERAAFTCEARIRSSEEYPHFLWYKDLEPLVGEVHNIYVVEEATVQDAGVYCCVITHPSDRHSKRSRDAFLAVKSSSKEPQKKEESSAPVIVEQPDAYVEATVGKKLQLVIKASGVPPLKFKWYKDSKELAYGTSSVLEIPIANQLDDGQYCCSVANDYGSILSDIYQVKVLRRPRASRPKKPAAPSKSSAPVYSSSYGPKHIPKGDLTLSDSDLWEMGDIVARQNPNWSRLALYLGLSNNDTANIKLHFHKPEEQAFQLLRVWRNQTHRERRDRRALEIILSRAGLNLSPDSGTPQLTPPPRIGSKPKICIHPCGRRVIYGQPVNLLVKVENADLSTSYQWFRNNKPLVGKTFAELVIGSATFSDDGEYFCEVSNQAGSAMSNVARIDIVDASARSVGRSAGYPRDPWGHQGTTPSPVLTTRSVPDRDEDEDMPQGQPVALTTTPTQPPTTASQAAASHVQAERPKILEHPCSQVVEAGEPLTLTCKAVGPGELRYLWYFNGLSMKGETRPEYFINFFTDDDEGLYACEVSNKYGHVMSDMARVEMNIELSD